MNASADTVALPNPWCCARTTDGVVHADDEPAASSSTRYRWRHARRARSRARRDRRRPGGARRRASPASGSAFCGGPRSQGDVRAPDRRRLAAALFERCSRVMLTLHALPQPVIARVHGIATAAGCQLVATCDLAVASTDSREFALPGVNVGLFCSTPGVPVSRNVAAQARDRDAAHRRVHRRADGARTGGSSTASCRRPSSTPRSAAFIGIDPVEKPRAVVALRQARSSTSRSTRRSRRPTLLAGDAITRNMLGAGRRRGRRRVHREAQAALGALSVARSSATTTPRIAWSDRRRRPGYLAYGRTSPRGQFRSRICSLIGRGLI